MKASEAFKRLKDSLDIKYYIGQPAVDAIAKACEDKPVKKVATKGK